MLYRVIFDTSGINALKDGGAASKPLMRGLACGFHVILTGLSAGEIIATSDAGDSAAISIQGGTNIYINGEILAPLAAVTVGNGSGTTINTNILAKTLNMNGGGTLTNTATTNLGSVSAGGASYLTQ